MKIADGLAPIPALLKAGVTVALGTDGAMWSNSNDLFREMKCLLLVHSLHGGVRTLTAHDALDMATVNGAKLFGLENELGTIEQGKLADLILVDASRPHMTPLRTGRAENVSSNVVYCATGADVTDVFVGGRRLVPGPPHPRTRPRGDSAAGRRRLRKSPRGGLNPPPP